MVELRELNEQLDHEAYETSVQVDVSSEEFNKEVIPYCIGYMSSSHGLTNVEYSNQRLVFTRTADES